MVRLSSLKPAVRPLAARLRPPPKTALPFYQTPEWRRLAARIKRERGPRCEVCGSGHRVIADHIVELSDGGAPLDPSNVQLLCQAHHNRKTEQARARRALSRV